jgi:anti-sigma factor (TIGR02949 family)
VDCPDARDQLLDYQHGRLAPELAAALRRHLDECPDCAHADLVDRALTRILERRTPQHAAPIALKRKLAAIWPAPAQPRARTRWTRVLFPAGLAVAALLVVAPFARQIVSPTSGGGSAMVTEAVNDHVRLLQSQRPLEVESGGIHQVIPWFSGKLDFAPGIRFPGDAEFPLQGGAVGYFLDRKAATLVFGGPRSPISLFVVKADGLPWPRGKRAEISRAFTRGFNVLLWRDDELGYALVSSEDERTLIRLAEKLGAPA